MPWAVIGSLKSAGVTDQGPPGTRRLAQVAGQAREHPRRAGRAAVFEPFGQPGRGPAQDAPPGRVGAAVGFAPQPLGAGGGEDAGQPVVGGNDPGDRPGPVVPVVTVSRIRTDVPVDEDARGRRDVDGPGADVPRDGRAAAVGADDQVGAGLQSGPRRPGR